MFSHGTSDAEAKEPLPRFKETHYWKSLRQWCISLSETFRLSSCDFRIFLLNWQPFLDKRSECIVDCGISFIHMWSDNWGPVSIMTWMFTDAANVSVTTPAGVVVYCAPLRKSVVLSQDMVREAHFEVKPCELTRAVSLDMKCFW